MGFLDPPRRRRSVAVGVFGQSNEHGAVSLSDKAAYPQAFYSLRRSSVRAPIGPAIQNFGGWLFKVYDDLYDAGWDPIIVNGALGSVSFIKDAAGLMGSWAASTIYFRYRPPAGPVDRGYAGDLIQSGGGIWRCIAGNDKFALNIGPDLTATPGRGDGYLDTVVTQPGGRPTGQVVTLAVTGSPTGGTYTLVGNGNTTATIAYNASASTVQTALRTLGGMFAAAAVTGAASGYTVALAAASNNEPVPLALGTNSLTGGSSPTVTVIPNTFVNYRTGGTTAIPSDVTGFTRGTVVTETPGSATDAGVAWRFEGFATNVPPNGNGTVTAWPLAGVVLTDTLAGMGFDPLGLLHRLHEEMQRVQADRKIIYLANGQADLGFASTSPSTVSTTYRDALISIGNFFLNRGYEVMVGLTNYSPGSSGTTVQWDNLKLAVAAALTSLQAGTDGSRVYAGADLYTLMGTTGPMASGGLFLKSDNIHLNGRGCIGPVSSGVQPAGKLVADAVKTVLAS